MNSRERVLASINHQQPDRIPIDLGATASSGIAAIAYNKLKQHLGIKTGKTLVYDVVQQLAQPESEILNLVQADILDLGRTFNTQDSDWYSIKRQDQTLYYPTWFRPTQNLDGSFDAISSDGTKIAHMPSQGYFFDQSYIPYKDGYPENYNDLPKAMKKVLWSGLAHSPWDHASEPNFWDSLKKNAQQLRHNTDKAIILGGGCNLFEWGTFLRGLDRFLVDLIRTPAKVEKLLDALMESHLAGLAKICDTVGDTIDILRFGDDLGTNDRPFLRPSIYQQFFKPRHKQLCKYVKDHSNMRTFLHSCGAIEPLIPDLIECGYDILNPVQISCEGMDPVGLKKNYGSKITFWGGGADTRNVLPRVKPNEVKKHVSSLLKIFAPGGGFIFNQVHNILPDVPPENIMAMYEAVHEFKYEQNE